MRAASLFLALAAAIFIAAPCHAAEPIKIGAIFSVTGPASFLGEPERNTVQMLADELNASGGLLGRKVEVIVYDDETDVNKAVLAADKLIKKDRVVAVLGPSTSGNSLAVMSKFERAHIPLVSCAAAEKITSPVNPWIFKVAPSDRHAAEKILEDAKSKGYKRIAIITVSDGFGQSGREALKELIPAQGFTLVADESYGPKDTDMTAQLTKINAEKPDAIICWGTNPGPAVIARERVQLGMTTPLYMCHGVASKKFIELAGPASEGLILPAGRLLVASQVPDSNPAKAVLMKYVKDYEAKYHQPVSTFGGHGYDSFTLVADAIRAAGSDKPQAIRDALEKADMWGTAGHFQMSKTDHNGLSKDTFELLVIKDGDWKILH
ncbi:ABC transporter substrate binding protein precursor [Desulfovibrio sp. X2]|uniref:ABC transporter substrate-binding protein n=1 Tax=Desulfovibrio sp. X2 TaxID=941449 RepID=UPI00035890BA|nr:ABC transporter substrate-binding protein [Desulfovibrio sp. X2]EPR41926.1 ABC transporter substrate binding protein precursor [Desulfovibrio sp. X2]